MAEPNPNLISNFMLLTILYSTIITGMLEYPTGRTGMRGLRDKTSLKI